MPPTPEPLRLYTRTVSVIRSYDHDAGPAGHGEDCRRNCRPIEERRGPEEWADSAGNIVTDPELVERLRRRAAAMEV